MVFIFSEIIIGIVIGALIAGAISFGVVTRLKSVNRLSLIAQVELTSNSALEGSIYKTCVDRALIIKLHNGGSKIYAGTNKYITVLHEAHSKRMEGVSDDFQRYPADTNYMSLMAQIAERRLIKVNVSEMQEGFLKRRYEHDGITAAVIFWIKETEGGMYYGSFTTTNDPELLLVRDFPVLESKINRLRNKYAKAYKSGVLH